MVGLVRVASQRRLTEVKIPDRLGLHREIFRKMIFPDFPGIKRVLDEVSGGRYNDFSPS